jgi:predicted CoA-binding protein
MLAQPLSQALKAHNPATLALNFVTPPTVTLAAVKEALSAGVTHLWLQPGAECDEVLTVCKAAGVTPIMGGPCVLVALNEPDDM